MQEEQAVWGQGAWPVSGLPALTEGSAVLPCGGQADNMNE